MVIYFPTHILKNNCTKMHFLVISKIITNNKYLVILGGINKRTIILLVTVFTVL